MNTTRVWCAARAKPEPGLVFDEAFVDHREPPRRWLIDARRWVSVMSRGPGHQPHGNPSRPRFPPGSRVCRLTSNPMSRSADSVGGEGEQAEAGGIVACAVHIADRLARPDMSRTG